MLVVAHLLEIIGEHFGEGVTVGNGIVVTFFLFCFDSFSHLFRCFGKDVKLIELGDGAINHAGSRGSVNLETQIRDLGAGMDGAQREAGDLGGIALSHFQLAKSGYPVAAPLDEEFEMERFALDDLAEFETTSHATELHLAVQRLAGIVLLEVSVKRNSLPAVEGVA